MKPLSHLDDQGRARMVDISEKPVSRRESVAEGTVFLQKETVRQIRARTVKKGEVLSTARVAGICAAKRTSELIPLCHNILINQIDIHFDLFADYLKITAVARCESRTGIEMEALTGVAVAALTVYDMCKGVDSTIRLSDIHLVSKKKSPSEAER